METTTKLIGAVATAMVLSIAFSGVALAGLNYYYQPDEVVEKMDYYPCITDGFIKDMDVDTGDEPNLNVMKSIGYVQRIPGVYHGRIAAEFSVFAEAGSAGTDLGSRLTHYEKSSANGWWEFSKEMGYESRIRP